MGQAPSFPGPSLGLGPFPHPERPSCVSRLAPLYTVPSLPASAAHSKRDFHDGLLETYPHSTIDDSTVERCPGIDGPAAIGGSLRA